LPIARVLYTVGPMLITTPIAAMTRGEVRYLDGLTDDFRSLDIIASPWPSR